MNVSDLPLPLRLRNALLKAGFNTADDLREWDASMTADAIPGIGATGMKQLVDWLNDDRLTRAGKELSAFLEPAGPIVRGPGPDADAYAALETPEESVARSMRRHEVNQMVDRAMRGGLEGFDRLSDAEIRRRTDVVTRRGGSIVVEDGRGLLALRLEAEIQARITGLIPTIKALPHVKELGVEVSAETVGRMALIRGLDSLERSHKGGAKAETAQNQPVSAENRDDLTPIPPPDDAEELTTPEGWSKVGPNDKIPVPEAVLHDYYTQNGWFRYWGMVDGTPIYFYWSPRRSLQGLNPFPGTDKSGRKVAVQETPWGPGHVVPVKWANS